MSGQTVGHYFIEIPDRVGDDVCQFGPKAGREPDRRPPERRVRNRNRRPGTEAEGLDLPSEGRGAEDGSI